MLQHVLPNVIAPVVIAATLGVAGAIMAEAALSFLGLGVPPPTPSWGSMIADGRDLDQLRRAPWTSVFPGMAIGAAVLGFNLLGDALRDALDPRSMSRAKEGIMIRVSPLPHSSRAWIRRRGRLLPAQQNRQCRSSGSNRWQEDSGTPCMSTSPRGDARLFVVEQAGRILVVKNGSDGCRTPFLDISERVRSGGEQGLLSVAFHPSIRSNGWFFVDFTDRQGDTRVERFKSERESRRRRSGLFEARDRDRSAILESQRRARDVRARRNAVHRDGRWRIRRGSPSQWAEQERRSLPSCCASNVNRAETVLRFRREILTRAAPRKARDMGFGMRNPWRFAFDRPTGLALHRGCWTGCSEEIDVEPARQPD